MKSLIFITLGQRPKEKRQDSKLPERQNITFYSDTFCDAMGKIYQAINDKTTVVGFTDAADYSFDDSEAVVDGQFVGLALDEDNESRLTEKRIDAWLAKLQKEIA